MNKSKIILAAAGGVMGVGVLVTAYLVWCALSAKTEALEGGEECEGLDTVVENANRLSRKPVYPCAESVRAVTSNETTVIGWKEEAFKLASRGDRPVKAVTPAQFKTDMVDEAKRLLALPGAVQGKIAKPDFAFGPFKEYISEGKMPSEGRLAVLQRQWDDLTLIVEALAASGISELLDIQLRQETAEPAAEEEQNARGKKRARKTSAKAETPAVQASSQAYTVTFFTRPLGLIKCLNALETNERFFVVDDFTFIRERDVIAEALGGGEKKEARQQSGRRRRRGAAVQQEETESKPKNGIVTDPLLDAPLKVELKVSTYDFGTLQEPPKEEVKK